MRRLYFGLAYAFGWLIVYVLLVLGGEYTSPLGGGKDLQSGLFVLASAVPGMIASVLITNASKIVVPIISGSVADALLIPIVSLCSSILDAIGSKGYWAWIIVFVIMQFALSMTLINVVQAILLRLVSEKSLRKQP